LAEAVDAPSSDGPLVERARAGDLAAFEQLLRGHQAVAERVAVVIAGPDDADDVLQEAFLRAHRALDRFRAEADFRPWLLAIVANQARNHRRSAWRRGNLALRLGTRAAGSGPATPDDAAVGEERRRLVLDALSELAPKDRLVIACRYLLELSEAETVAVTGWPAGTVKSRLSRALGRLQDVLAPRLAVEVHDA
jgi:RNA polymerase sigma-70 factor (ECF subfamily)